VSYEPLHHKYRPQIFADLVGQEAIATTLTQAIATQRIAPAYLFTGPRGTGKTSSARILAKSLNCIENSVPTAQPCGKCNVCLSIASNYAVDVIEIDAASNTGVDNIREIIERAQFAPVQCRYKVYVIDECHMLSTAAFNSLLKTLEEPPDRVVFVLATTDPQRVLPTIISRCQRFDFRRIPLQAMVQHLQYIANQESIDITPEAIALVAQVAQGGLRDAESLLDQLSLLTVQISSEKVWDLVGAVSEQDLLALTKAIASNNPESVLEHCRRLMDRGREPLIVLQNLAGFYRDLLIAKTAPNRPDLTAITPTTWTQLQEFAKEFDLAQILLGSQHLKTSEAQVKNTTQPRLWLEVTLLGLLPDAITPAPTQVISNPFNNQFNAVAPSNVIPITAKANRADVRETPAPTASNTPPEAASTPLAPIAPQQQKSEAIPAQSPQNQESGGSSNQLNYIWQQLLAYLQPSSKALFSQHGYLLSFNGQQAQIGIRAPKLIKAAQPKVPELESAFQKVLQKKIHVSLSVNQSGATPSQAPPGEITNNPQSGATPSQAPPGEITNNQALPSPISTPTPQSPKIEQFRATPPLPMPAPTFQESTNLNPAPPQLGMSPTQDPPPAPPLVADDWNVEEVETALGNLKQFFNGEIVDLDEFGVNAESRKDTLSATVAKLEASLGSGGSLPTMQEALPRRQEDSTVIEPMTPQRPLTPQPEWDDDDDIPF
jgi:DNA polymerase III subunit gamma/tau